jgi:hypothetical protein
VLEVVDSFLGVASGRWALDASPEGATCERTDAAADVTLDVAALGAIWVGGADLRELAAGGGRWAIDEHRADAIASAAALFRWHETPYCSTDF